MDRGSVVIISAKGDYGKPRPAIVVQDARMERVVDSITVCFLTTDLVEEGGTLRVDVAPTQENGLRERSQIQIEKLMTFPREKVRGPVGRIDLTQMRAVDIGLLVHLGLAAQLGVPTPQLRP